VPSHPQDVADKDDLHRRIVTSHLRSDGTVNSSLFKRPPGRAWDSQLSFDLARLASATETATRGGRTGFGVVALVASVPRGLGYEVRHDPNPTQEPDNYAHCVVEGETDQTRAWLLAAALRIVLQPER